MFIRPLLAAWALAFVAPAPAFAETGKMPVIVSISGYATCPVARGGVVDPLSSRNGARLQRLVAAAQAAAAPEDREARWVVGCNDANGNLRWRSAHGGVATGGQFSVLQPLIDAVTAETGEDRSHPVMLVGASHGGWVAMQVANRLPQDVSLAALITLDPISATLCRPSTYFGLFLGVDDGRFAACQSAPPDISPTIRQRILDRLGPEGWRHYYQRRFRPLRSSAFAGTPQPQVSLDLSAAVARATAAERPSGNSHMDLPELQMLAVMQNALVARLLAPAAR